MHNTSTEVDGSRKIVGDEIISPADDLPITNDNQPITQLRPMIDPASVAFDIDGVIADTMTLFLEIARDEFHINGIRYEDIVCYDLAECIRMDREVIDAVVKRILDGKYATALKPIGGVRDVLTRIEQHHSPVLCVTARPYLGPIRNWMLDLLSLESDSIDILAVGSFENKADVLVERNIRCFVEDRLETCYRLQDVGITSILFKQPWNREPHPFVEVESWEQLEGLIDFKDNASDEG
ncbi:haloacid dehalogenase [Thermodesulfobacteriota bacterium]